MALREDSSEDELQGQFSLLSATSFEVTDESEDTHGRSETGILDLSDEVFILILRRLDPTSLLRVGSTCRTLFRVCSCNSLWTKHFQVMYIELDFSIFFYVGLKFADPLLNEVG